MKRTVFISIILALPVVFSCKKDIVEENLPLEQKAVSVTALKVAPGEATKTAFVGGVYMWKTNDDFVVRSNNANGYSTFKYSGDDTAGSAQFTINSSPSEDKIVTGNLSFAVYPAETSGSGAEAFPREDEGSLKIVLKNSYNWAEGNVEAPMLAKVPDDPTTEALEFKHLGGVLKLTYKNVPPKAAKLIVSAPAGEGECYKICDVMKKTWNWDSSQGGFTGDTPYLQAYVVSGNKEITQNISSATAEQRTSADGLTVYVPLPVGPGNTHVYPKIKIRLAFNDGTTVPGSERTASNVKIERAVIKKMEPIALTKYTVEVVAGTDGSAGAVNGTGTAAKFNQVRGLCWKDNANLLLTESNGSKVLRQYNKSTHAVSSAVTLGGSAPWQGEVHNGVFYYADKGANKVRSWNISTNAVADVVTTGLNNPMCVRFNGDDAYVGCRNGSVIYKWTGGFGGTKSIFFDCSTLEVGSTTGETNWPVAMDFDGDGNMLLTMSTAKGTSPSGYKVYVISPTGAIITTIGKGTKSTSFGALTDGSVSAATFGSNVNGLVYGPDGAIYMLDDYTVRRIVKGDSGWTDAIVTTILGGGNSYLSSVGALCQITQTPQDLIFDPENPKVFYFFDWRFTLRKVTID